MRHLLLVLLATFCAANDAYFQEEVWAKVGELTCLKCHNDRGDAADSRFILRDTMWLRDADLATANSANQTVFRKMAGMQKKGRSRLLAKVVGDLDHEGEQALKPDSTGFRILQKFVAGDPPHQAAYTPEPFFAGVTMLDGRRLRRRLTLSLTGRLPTPHERTMPLGEMLDGLMREDAFFDRLKEGFNDIFLTLGYDGNGETALSYVHFEKSRLWYQKHDLSHAGDADAQTRARWALSDVYRQSILREPLELIRYIVEEERPFTEIVTADYIMVSPYSSRGYGIFEDIRAGFANPDEPFEYIRAQLPALRHRDGSVQESPTGRYPHAGLLSMFQYLRRYPTTETNRNRLRARMYYQQFLGIDVMELAPRVTDAAATDTAYKTPWMEAADCVVCHRSIDPVAGLFQDFYNEEGHYGPRKEGWFTDVFVPGLEGEDLPPSEKWRALQWLGERTARDPRFAIAMIEHVWYILSGRKVLVRPQDIEDPMFAARRRAYQIQRREIETVARKFTAANFNLKVAFKALAESPFYRADGVATAAAHPHRQAELDDLGLVRLLSPEQLERKITVLFGRPWDRLKKQMAILYGGIDSKTVTERIAQPSGAMGAIQRIMANDVACRHVVPDFAASPANRRLFPGIEPDVLPGTPSADAQIRAAIVHLHRHLLGRQDSLDDPEVDRSFAIFADILAAANSATGIDKRATYFCGRIDDKRVPDPHYTLRAWRAVVTYLLRQQEFVYE
jgi:hypothetical protein